MISAHEFEGSPQGVSGYAFGVGALQSAAALRTLADRIERGEVIVQKVDVMSSAVQDVFTLTTLHIEMAEKVL